MSLIGLILVLVVVGVILYLVPMEAGMKALVSKVATVVVLVLLVIWLLGVAGLWHPASSNLKITP